MARTKDLVAALLRFKSIRLRGYDGVLVLQEKAFSHGWVLAAPKRARKSKRGSHWWRDKEPNL
jgi:hypothetical protein